MSDLIDRQAAIDAHCELCDMNDKCICIYCKDIERFMNLPTADLSEYCDTLWKTAYERGKAEARPKRGSWDVRYDEEYAEDGIVICSECGEIYANEGFYWYKAHYCPNCGCRMKEGEEDDRE